MNGLVQTQAACPAQADGGGRAGCELAGRELGRCELAGPVLASCELANLEPGSPEPVGFTQTQLERLAQLGMLSEAEGPLFDTDAQRDRSFQKKERKAVADNRQHLLGLLESGHEPAILKLQRHLAAALQAAGFTELATPTVIPATFLEKMSITKDHPLCGQVFWLGERQCLRPMLAPGLYAVSEKLLRFAPLPLRVFEIGSCFRRESEGRQHLSEFTMLNLVEWGTAIEERQQRQTELMSLVLSAANVTGYRLVGEDSEVYGAGIDAVSATGLELASSSMGPHPLDPAWRITVSWVGIGFGLERLLMLENNDGNIHRHSRSLSYLDGACLAIK